MSNVIFNMNSPDRDAKRLLYERSECPLAMAQYGLPRRRVIRRLLLSMTALFWCLFLQMNWV